MDFRPEQPMHNRYAVTHDFLSPQAGLEADYANACPDVAVTSLHYFFPWAITALARWSAHSEHEQEKFMAHFGGACSTCG